MIKDHCVENDIIDEVEEKPIAETAEVVKLKLEFQREERRLEREEWRLEREEAQKACDNEKAAREEARELRLAELKEARELPELELKAVAEKEAAARDHNKKCRERGCCTGP